jgi:ABC-type taurine transport system substrate-binding protein
MAARSKPAVSGAREWSRRDILRGGLALGAAGLAAPLLAACGSSSGGGSTNSFALGYQSTPDSGMFYLAQKNGWFSKAGINPKLLYFATGPALIQGLASGNPAIGHVGSVPVLQTAASGLFPIRIVDVMADVGAGYNIVTKRSITRVEDLRGQKIGLGVGTNDQYFLDAVLKKFGMTEKDVEMVNFDPVSRQQAFLSGSIPAVIPLIENSYQILKQGVDSHIVFQASDLAKAPNPVSRPLIFDFLVAPQAKVSSLHDAFAKLSTLYNDTAIDYVTAASTKQTAIKDLTTWSSNVIKNPTTGDAVERKLATYTFYRPASALEHLLSSGTLERELHNQAEFLVRIGQSKSIPDFSKLIAKDLILAGTT